jgi:hypothetical protein
MAMEVKADMENGVDIEDIVELEVMLYKEYIVKCR